MKIESKKILDTLKEIDADIEITITKDEITIYWENIRVECSENDITKAVNAIKTLIKLNCYFE